MTTNDNEIHIVGYQDDFAPAFRELNMQWLSKYELLDPADEKYLMQPKKNIIDCGGEIFFAIVDGEPLGTCCAIKESVEVYELAKLAVAQNVQGRGIGRKLCEAVIDFARARGACKVVLESSTKLRPATQLYESLGFQYISRPAKVHYEIADLYMELEMRLPNAKSAA